MKANEAQALHEAFTPADHTQWTAADEAAFKQMQLRRQQYEARIEDKLQKVLVQMGHGGANCTHMAEEMKAHASALIEALQPFADRRL